jgi:ribosomal protein S18 acetylase RimI-like enzyme/uridine kinase
MVTLEVLPPGDPRAAAVLREQMADLSGSYYGRPATAEEIDEGLVEFPSDDLAPPTGLFVVASDGQAPVGCGGLRFGLDGIAEVTRVFVSPSHRRRGLGARVVGELERLAIARGIRELRLDTRHDLVEAQRLYRRLGFREVPAFNSGPFRDRWFAKRLPAAPALATAAERIAALPRNRRVIVAIDGVDGAGKSTFGNALAALVERPVVRASADDFLNPSAVRYRLGRESPHGFYEDSVDRSALAALLLDPFAAGGAFRRRAFDHVRDERADAAPEDAPADAALLLDGLFLHHPALRERWDLSILLDVPPEIAARRLLQREGDPTRHRYVRGQELYFADVDPAARAGLVLPW